MKLVSLIALAITAATATAIAAPPTPATVANIKVLSDKVPDVSSLDAWKASFIKPGMTDKEKALAIWQTVATFQHQDAPPSEFLQNEGTVYDAIKMFNVYGYSYCGVAACEMTSLARYVDVPARVRTIVAHVVPELSYDNQWHLLDASLISYFVHPDGDIASIDDVVKSVQDFLKDHPDLKGNDKALRDFQAQNNWTGWKNGPTLLANSPLYDATGWWPAKTHGWYSTMQEYDGSKNTPFNYEAGYSLGYKVNIQLRPGEKLTRNWFNKGLHVNMDGSGGAPGCMNMTVGQGFLAYAATRFGDIAPGRVGNGTLEYSAPLADPTLAQNAATYDNLAISGKTLTLKDAAKPAVLEIRNPCSYVYLAGKITLNATIGAGKITAEFSDNNGLDFKPIATFTTSGEQTIDLSKLILRRYDYRLRFTLEGAGTSLNALNFTHDIQHSQRPLPAIDKGDNTITFSAGPQEGTITIEGSTFQTNNGKNLLFTDFHPVLENITNDKLQLSGDTGSITQEIATPGDITRMNILTHYRARGAKSGWDVQVSYDNGKTFTSVTKAQGPTAFNGNYVVLKDIPPHTKSAKIRWQGFGGSNGVMIFNLRIDADYQLPASGFRPVKVTYLYDEAGAAKTNEWIVTKPADTKKIHCDVKPTMKSIILELQ
ncbi:MAG: hypothetical protein FWD61_11705 [Phycisphaerales bacterium]|nr:hypothetical protein [Phycisphaerales bacterium]